MVKCHIAYVFFVVSEAAIGTEWVNGWSKY